MKATLEKSDYNSERYMEEVFARARGGGRG